MRTIGVSLIIACVGLIVLCLMFTRQSDAKIDPKVIVGIWLFDEEDKKVKDISGNDHHGEIGPGRPRFVKGKYGKAFESDGSAGVDCGNEKTVDMKGKSITVAALVKTKMDFDEAFHAIIQKGRGPGSFQMHFNAHPDTPFLRWNPVPSQPVDFLVDLTDDKWHYIVGVFDDSKDTSSLYIDGEFALSVTEKGKIGSNKDNLRLGSDWAPKNTWIGTIDEIGLFSIALSKDEAKSIMSRGIEAGALAVSPKDKLATSWGYIKAQ